MQRLYRLSLIKGPWENLGEIHIGLVRNCESSLGIMCGLYLAFLDRGGSGGTIS